MQKYCFSVVLFVFSNAYIIVFNFFFGVLVCCLRKYGIRVQKKNVWFVFYLCFSDVRVFLHLFVFVCSLLCRKFVGIFASFFCWNFGLLWVKAGNPLLFSILIFVFLCYVFLIFSFCGFFLSFLFLVALLFCFVWIYKLILFCFRFWFVGLRICHTTRKMTHHILWQIVSNNFDQCFQKIAIFIP